MRHCDIQRQSRQYLVANPAVSVELPAWLFNPAELERRGRLRATSDGRRQAWFFRHADMNLVLRHYWRGGMIAVLSEDVYAWSGLRRTRPVREYRLLAALRARLLPVPQPIAARVERVGAVTYRGDLITRAIPDARPFATRLAEDSVPDRLWRAVGRTVARFHRAGAGHADLNARNIVLDRSDTVWLIDWDRGRMGRPGRAGRGNLPRLRRSLAKDPTLDRLAERHWSSLTSAYNEALRAPDSVD